MATISYTKCPVCGKMAVEDNTKKCSNQNCPSNTLELAQQDEFVKTRRVRFGQDLPGLYICNSDMLTISVILDIAVKRSNDLILNKHLKRMAGMFSDVPTNPRRSLVINIWPDVGDFVRIKDGKWQKVVRTNKLIERPNGIQLEDFSWHHSMELIGIARVEPSIKNVLSVVVNEDYKLYLFRCRCGYTITERHTHEDIAKGCKNHFEVVCDDCGEPISALTLKDVENSDMENSILKKLRNKDIKRLSAYHC